jgi:hypothetical protein
MTAPPLDTVLRQIGELQAPLPAATSVLIGVGALGAVALSAAWLMVRHVSVITHEGAHAVMGSGMGGKITSVTMKPNGSGRTKVRFRGSRGSSVAVGAIGYLGPSLCGLGAAKLISVGHAVAVLWLALLALAILLPVLRNLFGVFSVILTGGLLYLVARYATIGAQIAVAYGISWFLLLSGVRDVLELRLLLKQGPAESDADLLKGLTRIPRGFWSSLWLMGTVAGVVVGGSLLV